MKLFAWAHMAFRSVVRAEVERAMEDRRRAFARHVPVSDAELASIAATLKASGVTVRAPCALPLPANDHVRPPHPAA